MNPEEFKKYIELISSMCLDYLMGRTTQENVIFNLKLILKKFEEGKKNEQRKV